MSGDGSSTISLNLFKGDTPEEIEQLLLVHTQYIKGLVAGNGPAHFQILTTVQRKS